MKIVFSDHTLPDSISKTLFLAGPSIRDYTQRDWRHDAIQILENLSYNGIVFIPIPEDVFYQRQPLNKAGYDNQIQWEKNARRMSDVIVFWVPRNMQAGVYGLTTNFELGEDLKTGRVIYGRPDEADKCRYLDKCVTSNAQEVYSDLNELLTVTISFLTDHPRINGEVYVPSNIWKQPNFQDWLTYHKSNGGYLKDANVNSVWPTKFGTTPFFFNLKVNLFVAEENRFKENEFIISRTDISSIIPYYKDEKGETFVVMVKEFRSPVRNATNYVYEFPGGSAGSGEKISDLKNAVKELQEETGITVSEDRIEFVSKRQLASTLSIHSSSLYKVLLTKEEFDNAYDLAKKGVVFEDEAGLGERTFLVVTNTKQIRDYPVDYSVLGMLMDADI